MNKYVRSIFYAVRYGKLHVGAPQAGRAAIVRRLYEARGTDFRLNNRLQKRKIPPKVPGHIPPSFEQFIDRQFIEIHNKIKENLNNTKILHIFSLGAYVGQGSNS